MAEERALAAMRRIEEALGRIEAAAAAPAGAGLARRHAALRDGVRAIVARLDGMIDDEATA